MTEREELGARCIGALIGSAIIGWLMGNTVMGMAIGTWVTIAFTDMPPLRNRSRAKHDATTCMAGGVGVRKNAPVASPQCGDETQATPGGVGSTARGLDRQTQKPAKDAEKGSLDGD